MSPTTRKRKSFQLETAISTFFPNLFLFPPIELKAEMEDVGEFVQSTKLVEGDEWVDDELKLRSLLETGMSRLLMISELRRADLWLLFWKGLENSTIRIKFTPKTKLMWHVKIDQEFLWVVSSLASSP